MQLSHQPPLRRPTSKWDPGGLYSHGERRTTRLVTKAAGGPPFHLSVRGLSFSKFLITEGNTIIESHRTYSSHH